jgi:hypothetical protein
VTGNRSLWSRFFVVFAFATVAVAADNPARIVFIKSFPGSVPAYIEIPVDSSGAGGYKEAPDDDPESFKLDAATTNELFDLAGKLDHFKRPVESGLKVANMGEKTFRWENGSEKSEARFNYSMDENAKALLDWFERISESERLLIVLRRAIRHDKLGVNEAILNIRDSWDRKRLTPAEQFLPLLDQVAKNDVYMHMSRERAAQLADLIRARQKSE